MADEFYLFTSSDLSKTIPELISAGWTPLYETLMRVEKPADVVNYEILCRRAKTNRSVMPKFPPITIEL